MIRTVLLAVSVLALSACGGISMPSIGASWDEPDPADAAAPLGATEAQLYNATGDAIGAATITEGPRGVMIRLNFNAGSLPPGWHGAHFHERGTCADAFRASGAHVGHDEEHGRHGLLNPEGPEPGDLPSFFAPASGEFGAEFFSPLISLNGDGDRPAILDGDGTALVLHENSDDQTSQPIGGAGGRIACAAFIRS